jgi:hypothetical protein
VLSNKQILLVTSLACQVKSAIHYGVMMHDSCTEGSGREGECRICLEYPWLY